MKKQFTCTDCACSYWANWTKGLCPTCRKRANYEKNYRSANPYKHIIRSTPPKSDAHIQRRTNEANNDIDWMEARHLTYNTHLRHHHRFGRGVIRSHNEINRNFFTGKY